MGEGTTEQRERFLAGEPEDTNKYRYSGLEDAEMKVYGEHRSPYVIFMDVPQSEVDKIDSKHLGRLDYQRFLQIMVVKMPTVPHEEALSRFSNLVTLKADRIQVGSLTRYRGITTTRSREREKEADAS